MIKFTKLFLFISLSFSLFTNSAYGTMFGTTGKIAGKAVDAQTGDALPFVNVIVEGTTLGAATDLDGNYSIINVPPGVYNVKASYIGYNTITVQNVKVSIDLTTKLDFELSSTELTTQEVVVTAGRPLIERSATASTDVVDSKFISELPVTNITDVLELQAGIVTDNSGGLHLRGGRAGQVAYQIDGVPITDAYDNSNVIEVAPNSVQELQVVSGAFNAEYGQAMSGIVNIVTRDGSNNFSGSVQAYSGDYVSGKDDKFWNIQDIDPIAIRNVEASLSGPILKDRLFFFVNGRYYYNSGYFYGKRTFLPTDMASEAPGSAGSDYIITQSGDNEYVAMNPDQRYFGQGKLTARIGKVKLTFNSMADFQEYKDYDQFWRLTPDNNLQRFRKGYTNTLSVNHAISNISYYTLNLSYFFRDYRHYLYEDINTPVGDILTTQYVNNFIRQDPPYSFGIGRTDYSRFTRNTGTYSAKLDWATQFTQEVNIQFGGELRQHRIYFDDVTLQPQYALSPAGEPYLYMAVPDVLNPDHDQYLKWPQEIATYLQSKVEISDLIFNIGVRFDVFNPDGQILADPTDPNIYFPLKPENQFFDSNGNGVKDPDESVKTVADREAYWFEDASIKYQVSPRVGLAFPISDNGVIHFSYGHFLQLPSYDLLYTNPEFELGVGSGNQGLFGNADLNPQKTVKGEIGIQQALSSDISADITMFFEDFRNLTGTQTEEILVYGRGQAYSKYANSDFGFARGIIVKLDKRFSGGLATSIDYTYSVTKGNASNPADARNAALGGALPETFIAPLDWDQTHTLNVSVAYSKARDYGFSMIGTFSSGQPYTPLVNRNTNVTQNSFPRNSGRKPSVFNIDLRGYKDIPLGETTTMSLFVKVYNLLDLDNPVNVWGETGSPYFTFDYLDAVNRNQATFYNSLEEYYNNPTYLSSPRRIEVGLSYNF